MAKTAYYEIGIIGLGVMGRNLLINMANHGYAVAGYNPSPLKVESLKQEAAEHDIFATSDLNAFVTSLRSPRAIILLVPAGPAVDDVIKNLLPLLQADDLIVDAGNSHFTDTNLRSLALKTQGIQFMGMGISGGEEGARLGPSIMPGGDKQAYERIRPLLEAVAAKVNGEPCVAYLGQGSAGHYVKMVHNGIEYAIMQLIAETYDVMKRGLGLSDDQLKTIYTEWNKTELSSYLLEITSHIFAKLDEKTGKHLIDEILGVAKQKGTGLWTSQSAMELQVPIPTIDIAVAMRDLSAFAQEREQASKIYPKPLLHLKTDAQQFLPHLHNALFAAMLLVYAQGMALLRVASDKYAYGLNLEAVARIWRGGCIIRATLLEDICTAFKIKPDLPNLLLDKSLAQKLTLHLSDLRVVVSQMAQCGIPTPAFMTSLSYLDAYCSAWLPANLIQAQRDYFGAHTYERIDSKGTFHTEWK